MTILCLLCVAFVSAFHIRGSGEAAWYSSSVTTGDAERDNTAPSSDGLVAESCHVCQVIAAVAVESGSPEHGQVLAPPTARLVSAQLKAIGPPPKS